MLSGVLFEKQSTGLLGVRCSIGIGEDRSGFSTLFKNDPEDKTVDSRDIQTHNDEEARERGSRLSIIN